MLLFLLAKGVVCQACHQNLILVHGMCVKFKKKKKKKNQRDLGKYSNRVIVIMINVD
jgi:hypothetical protein